MKIIFFDGNCPMCHGWVKALLRWDKKQHFMFAPLESEKARELLSGLIPDYLKEDTIVYYRDGSAYMRSDAVIEISKDLPFPFSAGVIGRLMPRRFRDSIYNKIAASRYKYGKRFDSCPVAPKEWRHRFLN